MDDEPHLSPNDIAIKLAVMAIEEAEKCVGSTRVGAVIACGSNVLATGFKGEVGGLHAEEVAIEKARAAGLDLVGTALYTTMEPCANSRTSRIPCSQLISETGIEVVHIGRYDPNPRVYRLGWKYLRDNGIERRDFHPDLRVRVNQICEEFTQVFERGIGITGGAKFDYTQNGGLFVISVDEAPDAPSWETRWHGCSDSAIYLYGGSAGVVAWARYAEEFDEVDDPDALDYGHHCPYIPVGSVGVMRNFHGHVLCKVIALEVPSGRSGTGHASVKIEWQIRLSKTAVVPETGQWS